MHALVLTRGEAARTAEGNQVHGFSMYRRELFRQLGLTCELVAAEGLREVERAILDRPADVAFVMVSWREDPERVVDLFRGLHARPGRPRLIFMDYYAPASSPFYGVLPYVDCYFKRQLYRDPARLTERFEGGNLLTDYLANVLGEDLDGWHFASDPDPDHLDKIAHGWNLGVSPPYRNLLRLTSAVSVPWRLRPYAINRRLGLPPKPWPRSEWYERHRDRCIGALEPLAREHRCTGWEKVSYRRYAAEMLLSRICVSPFGYGEVCFRDYEVIASGSLLIKPSMSHLRTSPDIYQAGRTYVEAAWDFSDVEELCRHYLAHPGEAMEIIRNGRAALRDYYEGGGFVGDVGRFLEKVGLTGGRAISGEGMLASC